MKYTTAELNAIIKRQPASEIGRIIDEYIHDARNAEIARRKILRNEPFEPLAEVFSLTPRHVNRIVRKAREIIVEHLQE